MFVYEQATGNLYRDGTLIGMGYSGSGEGKNNPDMQDVHDVGPIPCGLYTICDPFDDPEKGPCVMALTPAETNEMFGRSGFLIHGDSIKSIGNGSHGCIIQNHSVRANSVAAYLDVSRQLQVIRGTNDGTVEA